MKNTGRIQANVIVLGVVQSKKQRMRPNNQDQAEPGIVQYLSETATVILF